MKIGKYETSFNYDIKSKKYIGHLISPEKNKKIKFSANTTVDFFNAFYDWIEKTKTKEIKNKLDNLITDWNKQSEPKMPINAWLNLTELEYTRYISNKEIPIDYEL
jgi:hypothetical protein